MTAQSLGHAMSTLVVQELHLWLCFTDMKEQEKVQFLNAPVSQTGLFGDAVESCAQQFSAAQKQTETIKHIMRRMKPAASTLAATLQPARRQWRLPLAAPAPTLQQQTSTRQHCGADRRQDAKPIQPLPNPAASANARGPEMGDPEMEGTAHREMVSTPLPPREEGQVENLLFCFVFVPPLAHSTPLPGTCSVGAEQLQDYIRQDGRPTESLLEAPGAYGCSCGNSSTRSAPYETASALAPWPIPMADSTHYHFSTCTVHKTGLCSEVEPIRRMVFLSPGGPPEMFDQSCAFLFATRVGA